MRSVRGPDAQRGTTMFVALIMLVLLTLFAASALNTSSTNLKVVGNMQARSEALQVTESVIEKVISTPQFITSPSNAVPNACGTANTACTDITNDGNTDYTTRLTPTPTCVAVQPIKVSQLNLSSNEDLGCAAGQSQQFGVAGATSGDSLCSNSVWEITAQTDAAASGASVTVTQGVGVRISADESSACN